MPEFHDTDPKSLADGEPEGGWVTSDERVDTELLQVTLCRFTGEKASHSEPCPARERGIHPDEECRAIFVQGTALAEGRINPADFVEVPEEVRVPFAGEPRGGDHG